MNPNALRVGTIEMTVAMMLSGTIGYFVISSAQPFWNVVFFRCLIGALTLGAYAVFTGMIRREYFHKSVLLMIILGGITLVANWVFLFASFTYIPFSIATVAYHMQPLFLVLVSAWLSRERVSGHILFWLGIAFVGLFLMVELDFHEVKSLISGDTGDAKALIGLLLALGAAVLYTATTLITKKVAHIPPHFVALVQVVMGIFMLLPFADFTGLPHQSRQWLDLLILGAVHTGFMYIIMYGSFQKLPTHLIALLSFIYPVMALFVDYLAFDTSINWLQGLGVVMILLAVCAVKFDWRLSSKKAYTLNK